MQKYGMFLILIQWQLFVRKHLDNENRNGWWKRIQFFRMRTNGRLSERQSWPPDSFRAEDFVTTSLAINLRDTGSHSIICEVQFSWCMTLCGSRCTKVWECLHIHRSKSQEELTSREESCSTEFVVVMHVFTINRLAWSCKNSSLPEYKSEVMAWANLLCVVWFATFILNVNGRNTRLLRIISESLEDKVTEINKKVAILSFIMCWCFGKTILAVILRIKLYRTCKRREKCHKLVPKFCRKWYREEQQTG